MVRNSSREGLALFDVVEDLLGEPLYVPVEEGEASCARYVARVPDVGALDEAVPDVAFDFHSFCMGDYVVGYDLEAAFRSLVAQGQGDGIQVFSRKLGVFFKGGVAADEEILLDGDERVVVFNSQDEGVEAETPALEVEPLESLLGDGGRVGGRGRFGRGFSCRFGGGSCGRGCAVGNDPEATF